MYNKRIRFAGCLIVYPCFAQSKLNRSLKWRVKSHLCLDILVNSEPYLCLSSVFCFL